MLKAILVDDEASNLSALREKINRHCPDISVAAICESAAEGLAAINEVKPDLVFLDIEMPVMNGFLMLQQLGYKDFELIFTTAYDHYAIKAIRYCALDYLVKPIDIDELKTAVDRAVKKRSEQTKNHNLELLIENLNEKRNRPERIAVPTGEGLRFLKIDEIIYLEANVNYTHIYLEKGEKFIVCHTLKDFEEMLDENIFLRIHQSFLINKNKTERYIRGEGGQVVMKNGARLDVSKRKKSEFLKAISW